MSANPIIAPAQYHPDYPHGSRSAGKVIGKSVYWIRNTRQADAKRIAAGEDPVGPIWHYDQAGVPCYFQKDLINWIRATHICAIPDSGSNTSPETPDNTEFHPKSAV